MAATKCTWHPNNPCSPSCLGRFENLVDPDQLLKELREAAADVRSRAYEEDALEADRELADKFEAMDEWLTNGGFKPQEWSSK